MSKMKVKKSIKMIYVKFNEIITRSVGEYNNHYIDENHLK